MSTRYRLPKMFTDTTWSFTLDITDVEETEPATLTVGDSEYEATIGDSRYEWSIPVDLEPGEYPYAINTSVNLLYGQVEVR